MHSKCSFRANARKTAVIPPIKTPKFHIAFSRVDFTSFTKGNVCHYNHFMEKKQRQKIFKTLGGVPELPSNWREKIEIPLTSDNF